MMNQVARQEAMLNESLAIADAAWAMDVVTAPAAVTRFILEDHAGYPIECPLCGQVDRWRMERHDHDGGPRGFQCVHLADSPDGWVRRIASVTIDQVGGYLDPATLIPTAA